MGGFSERTHIITHLRTSARTRGMRVWKQTRGTPTQPACRIRSWRSDRRVQHSWRQSDLIAQYCASNNEDIDSSIDGTKRGAWVKAWGKARGGPHAEATLTTSTAGTLEYFPRSTLLPSMSVAVIPSRTPAWRRAAPPLSRRAGAARSRFAVRRWFTPTTGVPRAERLLQHARNIAAVREQ